MKGPFLVTFLVLSCVCACTGEIWIPTQEGVLCLNSSATSAKFSFSPELINRLQGRDVKAIYLNYISGVFCLDNAISHWGCYSSNLAVQIKSNNTMIAPSTIDDRVTLSGNTYTMTDVHVSDNSITYITNHDITLRNEYSVEIADPTNFVGLCVSVEFNINPYQELAQNVCYKAIMDGSDTISYFNVFPPYANAILSHVQLEYVGGGGTTCGVPLPLSPFSCDNHGYSFGPMLVDGAQIYYTYMADNWPNSLIAPNISLYDFWYTEDLYNAYGYDLNSTTIILNSFAPIRENMNIAFGYAEVFRNNEWGNNEGVTCARISGDYSRWQLLSDRICVGSRNDEWQKINISSTLLGKSISAIQFQYLNGSVNCDTDIPTDAGFWGCNTSVSEKFQITVARINGPALRDRVPLIPDLSNDRFAKDKQLTYWQDVSQGINDVYVQFPVKMKLTDDLFLAHYEDLMDMSEENNEGTTCLMMFALLDECAENNRGCVEGKCVSLDFGVPFCHCENGAKGTFCEDNNECERGIANCSAIGSICKDTIGGYNCSCASGFTGDGSACADINECLEDKCDPHVTCTNSIGSFSCTNCPFGYTGDGLLCTPLCGNGKCDADIGENCVTCFPDCNSATCDACGDGVCNGAETCATCSKDCLSTCGEACDKCKNGNCVSGACICAPGWSGPACDAYPQPITVTNSNSTPSVQVLSTRHDPDSPNKETTVSFGVSVTTITEIGVEGILFDMRHAMYTLEHSFVINYRARYESWTYSTTLKNKAHIQITFIKFEDDSELQMNEEITGIVFLKNTLKINVKIQKWPFKSVKNSLQVGFHLDTEMAGKARSCNHSYSNAYSLDWTKISFNGSSIYTRFLGNATLDNRNTLVKFSAVDTFTVYATVPHFWQFAELDPNYVVLIDPTACSTIPSHEINTALIIIIALLASLLVFLVGVGFYIYHKKFKKPKPRRPKQKYRRFHEDEDAGIEMTVSDPPN